MGLTKEYLEKNNFSEWYRNGDFDIIYFNEVKEGFILVYSKDLKGNNDQLSVMDDSSDEFALKKNPTEEWFEEYLEMLKTPNAKITTNLKGDEIIVIDG